MISLLVNNRTPKEDTVDCNCTRVAVGDLLIVTFIVEIALAIISGALYYEYIPSYTQDNLIIFASTGSALLIGDLAFAIFTYCNFGTPQKVAEQNYIDNVLREERRQWERKPEVLGEYMRTES